MTLITIDKFDTVSVVRDGGARNGTRDQGALVVRKKKKWSGWRRLWFTLSVVSGGPILVASFIPYKNYEYLDDVPEFEIRAQAEEAIYKKMDCHGHTGSWTSREVYPEETISKRVVPRVPPAAYVPPAGAAAPASDTPDDYNPPAELWGEVVVQRLMRVSIQCGGPLPAWWWWMAALPAIIMATIGLTARWIYHGFRPPLAISAEDTAIQ